MSKSAQERGSYLENLRKASRFTEPLLGIAFGGLINWMDTRLQEKDSPRKKLTMTQEVFGEDFEISDKKSKTDVAIVGEES